MLECNKELYNKLKSKSDILNHNLKVCTFSRIIPYKERYNIIKNSLLYIENSQVPLSLPKLIKKFNSRCFISNYKKIKV